MEERMNDEQLLALIESRIAETKFGSLRQMKLLDKKAQLLLHMATKKSDVVCTHNTSVVK